MPARRKPEHSNLVRIDVPLRGMKAHQPHRPLRIFQCNRRFRIRPRFRIQLRRVTRHTVLQQHTSDPLGRQPITDFRAFKIDGQNLIAPTRKHHYRNTRILSRRRIDRHRRPRDVAYISPRPASDQLLSIRRCTLRPPDRLRIGHRPWPDRHLRMSRRGLPGRGLRAQAAKRKYQIIESKDERPHRNCDPHSFSQATSTVILRVAVSRNQ